jgi:hypothetical protein
MSRAVYFLREKRGRSSKKITAHYVAKDCWLFIIKHKRNFMAVMVSKIYTVLDCFGAVVLKLFGPRHTKQNFDSLKREILTVWKRKILTV